MSHTVSAVRAAGHRVGRMFWVRDTSVCFTSFLVTHFRFTTHKHTHAVEKEANFYVPSGADPCQVALFFDH